MDVAPPPSAVEEASLAASTAAVEVVVDPPPPQPSAAGADLSPNLDEVASQSGSDNNGGDESSEDEWESESLYEDALHFVTDEQLRAGIPDACTLEEALAYRRQLHAVGIPDFFEKTVNGGTVSVKKLCTAFGIIPPAFLDGSPDRAYVPLLVMGMNREYSRRAKLPQYNTIDDAAELLKKSRKIIVLTGAGISTSLGIPDFRSKDVGLYAKLEHLGLNDPQEVFDIGLFLEDPAVFYSVARDILPSGERFSPTHAFIRLLQDKGKLLTNFTQNIDNLEAAAGVLPEKMIQCHGSFATATCIKCKTQVSGESIFDEVREGLTPECKACKQQLAVKPQSLKRKRSSSGLQKKDRKNHSGDSDDDEDYDIPQPGVMKPDITFFGEALPHSFKDRLLEHDREIADLVIVIGTSLKVAPVSEVPGIIPRNVPQIYISRTPVSHIDFDIDMIGDCDVVVAELCRRAGWDLQHEMIPAGQKIETKLEEGFPSRYSFSVLDN